MAKAPIGNRQLIRTLNRTAVLNMIKSRGPIGRAEIARRTGLSPATVSSLTADLIASQLVLETKPGESSGGRRPILLEINPAGGFVVGLKLTEDRVIAALINLDGDVMDKRTDRLTGAAPEQVVGAIERCVGRLLKGAGLAPGQLLGVGVGLAGVVDAEAGVSRQQPFLGWRDVPLGPMLAARLNTLVHIDNDVNALTLAERLYGRGQGVDDFLTVTVGRGVGLGIVIGGDLFRGARGGGGEFGHLVVDVDGPVCECGKRGCLEAYVGEAGLLRQAHALAEAGQLPPVGSVDELLALAAGGQPSAVELFARSGGLLGQGVANLVNLFNPARILISGEGVRYGDLFFTPMRQALAANTMPALHGDSQVRIDPWGDDAWAVGAASLVLRDLFVSPLQAGRGQSAVA
jgi:predicted NBD/HSP70 family sugar kinase